MSPSYEQLKHLLAAEIDRAGRAQVRAAELDREVIHLTELLMACADLNIPFPDPHLDDSEYARGIRVGHKEARDYCAKIAQKALPRNRFNCGETIKSAETCRHGVSCRENCPKCARENDYR